MPGPASSKPFANVDYLFPALVHCPTCDVLQPMHINGVQPALYCGKDMIFYQRTKCGNETTERVTRKEGSSAGMRETFALGSAFSVRATLEAIWWRN
jgi:hypothetical protein